MLGNGPKTLYNENKSSLGSLYLQLNSGLRMDVFFDQEQR
jgi:hypothetical protein